MPALPRCCASSIVSLCVGVYHIWVGWTSCMQGVQYQFRIVLKNQGNQVYLALVLRARRVDRSSGEMRVSPWIAPETRLLRGDAVGCANHYSVFEAI